MPAPTVRFRFWPNDHDQNDCATVSCVQRYKNHYSTNARPLVVWLGKKLEEIIRNYPRIRVIIKLKKHIFSGIISSNYFNFFPKRPLGLNNPNFWSKWSRSNGQNQFRELCHCSLYINIKYLLYSGDFWRLVLDFDKWLWPKWPRGVKKSKKKSAKYS